ncbi:hypothetical protein K8I61_12285 [bacterium]|nr:hypothetical protein [bacterium]
MRHGLAVACILILGVACGVIVACDGDEYDQLTRPINEDDGTYAKDRDALQDCDDFDVKIGDCYDACSCCVSVPEGESDHPALNDCIGFCDDLLLRINDVEHQSKADITAYKECVVGCFSVCEKPEPDVTCFDECAHYLGE